MLEVFDAAFAQCPLVAILRGLRPEEAGDIGEALIEAGFTLIEVPLNSPDPYRGIEALAKISRGRAIIGAGTVLTPPEVQRVVDAGGAMIVSPNTDTRVIAATVSAGIASLPGIATPSEAFSALQAGATALKLFPAEAFGPPVIKAIRAVLPPDTRVLAVGGITPEKMGQWREAGTAGFGLGAGLYAPGRNAADVADRAHKFVSAWQAG